MSSLRCTKCTRGDDEEKLMLCDGCNSAWHTFCLVPPLPDVPSGEWYCLSCISGRRRKHNKLKVQAQVLAQLQGAQSDESGATSPPTPAAATNGVGSKDTRNGKRRSTGSDELRCKGKGGGGGSGGSAKSSPHTATPVVPKSRSASSISSPSNYSSAAFVTTPLWPRSKGSATASRSSLTPPPSSSSSRRRGVLDSNLVKPEAYANGSSKAGYISIMARNKEAADSQVQPLRHAVRPPRAYGPLVPVAKSCKELEQILRRRCTEILDDPSPLRFLLQSFLQQQRARPIYTLSIDREYRRVTADGQYQYWQLFIDLGLAQPRQQTKHYHEWGHLHQSYLHLVDAVRKVFGSDWIDQPLVPSNQTNPVVEQPPTDEQHVETPRQIEADQPSEQADAQADDDDEEDDEDEEEDDSAMEEDTLDEALQPESQFDLLVSQENGEDELHRTIIDGDNSNSNSASTAPNTTAISDSLDDPVAREEVVALALQIAAVLEAEGECFHEVKRQRVHEPDDESAMCESVR